MSDAAADAVMAALPIKFVQVKTFKPTAAVTTLPFDAPVSAHDAIIVCLNFPISSGATLLSIADAAANDSYDVVVPAIDSGGTRHYVAIAQDVSASASAVTVTLSAPTVSGSDMFAIEYSGIATNNAFDVSANASGATAAMASGDATTTYANELILGYAEASSATAGNGFAMRATLSGNMVEDMVVDATGSYAATANTGGTGTWTMIMATFRGR